MKTKIEGVGEPGTGRFIIFRVVDYSKIIQAFSLLILKVWKFPKMSLKIL